MSRRRICQVLHGMTVGGAEVLADRLARRLSDRFEMVFACLDTVGELGDALRADGFQVECLGRKSGVDPGCAWRLARWIRQSRAELILAHQYTPFFYSLASRGLGHGRPIVFVEHGRAVPDYPRRKRILFNRLLVGRKDRLVAVGRDVRRALIENEGLPEDRVEVIYNGVNLQPYERNQSQRQEIRRTLGFQESDFIIAQVARLDSLKDHLTAIRTMARLVQTQRHAKLVLVGDGPERSAIEAEIAALEVGEHVRMLGLRSDVPAVLSGADAMLLTSISEGIPLTLIEGMAARLPIVSTNVGGIAEIVQDPETAFLAPARDVDRLATHLARLVSDKKLAVAMGEAGAEIAHARFSEPVMHARYEQLFEEVLGIERKEQTNLSECVSV